MSVVNSVASMRAGMNAPDRRHAVSAKHGCQKTGTLMRRPSRRSWRGRPPLQQRSCKMPWTTASRSMHLRRFWDRRKRRVVKRTRPLVINQSPTSQRRVTVPAGCNRKWSNRQSPMASPGRRRGRIVITTVSEMKIDAETVIPTPETVVLPDTGWNGVTRPVGIAVIIAVQHRERTSDRSREWSSTSSTATSTGSRHHDPTGQHGSSWQSRAEDRACGSTAQPAASSLSKCKTSSRGDLSGQPGSTQQARDQGGRCGSMDFLASPSMPRHGASTTRHSKSSSNGGHEALGIWNRQPTSRPRRRWPWIWKNLPEDPSSLHH